MRNIQPDTEATDKKADPEGGSLLHAEYGQGRAMAPETLCSEGTESRRHACRDPAHVRSGREAPGVPHVIKVVLIPRGDRGLRPINVSKTGLRVRKRGRSGILKECANKNLPASIRMAQGRHTTDAAHSAHTRRAAAGARRGD